MSDDKLPAELAEIRPRHYPITLPPGEPVCVSDRRAWPCDAHRLLGVVDKVLELTDGAVPVDRDYGGEPIWWNLTPEEIREAITRALTGEGDDA